MPAEAVLVAGMTNKPVYGLGIGILNTAHCLLPAAGIVFTMVYLIANVNGVMTDQIAEIILKEIQHFVSDKVLVTLDAHIIVANVLISLLKAPADLVIRHNL